MKQIRVYFLIFCTFFFLSGCSQQHLNVAHPSPDLSGSTQSADAPLQLYGIIVLPTVPNPTQNEEHPAEAENLELGAQTLTTLLHEYFSGHQNVTILNSTQAANYRGAYIGSPLQEARHIGNQANADAVLMTTIYRFRELDGKDFGADEPASVSFDYQLIHLESGLTLCKGSYDETQETLLANLLQFFKASKRKFKFVKGSALLKEGIEDKFPQCTHLAQ